MAKRHFWALFREAWGHAFTTKNIEAAWKATGIYPFDPDKIIATITRESTSPEPTQATAKTPKSARSMLRTFKQLRKEGHVNIEAASLLYAGIKLATNNEILHYEIEGLREGIIMEKKKRQRGKALGLYDEGGSPSQPLFFSPAKVAQVRQRATEEEQAKRQRKQAAEEKKHQAAITREQKALEKAERAAERAAK